MMPASFCCFVGFPPQIFNMYFTDLKLMKSELRTEKKVGFSFRKLKTEKLSGRISLNPSSPALKRLCQVILRENVHTYQASGNGFPGNGGSNNLKKT